MLLNLKQFIVARINVLLVTYDVTGLLQKKETDLVKGVEEINTLLDHVKTMRQNSTH